MTRYYIGYTSIFDGMRRYEKAKIANAIKICGGKNVRYSLQFGWSNQPQVVCYDATDSKRAQTIADCASDLVFPKNRSSLIHLLSYKKDW
jgi:hypothetical protein